MFLFYDLARIFKATVINSIQDLSIVVFEIVTAIIFVSSLLIGLLLFIQYSNFIYSIVKSKNMTDKLELKLLNFMMNVSGLILIWLSLEILA
ncbi:MAG: hypothetical protein HOL60_05970 [Pelagibacteraceae bacterium]|nr:hypothetical protein [Pelagibacteraceae bacterium]